MQFYSAWQQLYHNGNNVKNGVRVYWLVFVVSAPWQATLVLTIITANFIHFVMLPHHTFMGKGRYFNANDVNIALKLR